MAADAHAQNPFVGPRPFERGDSKRFFGRDRETRELASLATAHRTLLLYAQSGAGKTSLINAGLIPLLEEKTFEVLPVARVWGRIPKEIAPEEVANPYVLNALISWVGEEDVDPRSLTRMSIADLLAEREHPADEMGLPVPRVAIFDQFEDLFNAYPERWEERARFFEQVSDALQADPLLRVILVVREDYIANLDPYVPLLPDRLRTRMRLERMRKGAALAAAKGPLRGAGRSFAEGVAEQLVDNLLQIRVETAGGETATVEGEFVEPVQLQVVCHCLWRDLPPDVTVITQDHLQAFGDVNQALAQFYERCLQQTAQRESVRERALRNWFKEELITPAGTRGTAFRGEQETEGLPNAAVDLLVDLHLIRGERRAGAHWYELTHDRFIEPVQRSNLAWEERARRRKWRTVLAVLGAAVLTTVILVGLLVYATDQKGTAEKTATAAAAQLATATTQLKTAQAQLATATTQLKTAQAQLATVEAMQKPTATQTNTPPPPTQPPTATPIPTAMPTQPPPATRAPTSTPTSTPPPTATRTLQPTPTATSTPLKCSPVDLEFVGIYKDYEDKLGCPLGKAQDYPSEDGAWQEFEKEKEEGKGYMLWRGGDALKIYVLYKTGAWEEYDDHWVEPEDGKDSWYSCPDRAPSQSPPTPYRGFGKVWCDKKGVRDGLGWATEKETRRELRVQDFEHGIIFRVKEVGHYVLSRTDHQWEQLGDD